MIRGVLGISILLFIAFAAAQLNEDRPTPPAAAVAEKSATQESTPHTSGPFMATVDNEYRWRPDTLPLDWPKFTVVPNKTPAVAKTTDEKLRIASAAISKWQEYRNKTTKKPPSSKETGAAIDNLLSIKRDDSKFPEAWALFIDARIADRGASEYEAAIRDRKTHGVSVGMTAEQVMQSNWGKPQKINETITAGGKREQWVYAGFQYLYLENGVLTSIQTSR